MACGHHYFSTGSFLPKFLVPVNKPSGFPPLLLKQNVSNVPSAPNGKGKEKLFCVFMTE